ncbi:hypothetical protein TSMEX_008390 [Taenia solium]|eukprot:TsM_000933300 transcript=TsM_000933300 gene=TsM_000933300
MLTKQMPMGGILKKATALIEGVSGALDRALSALKSTLMSLWSQLNTGGAMSEENSWRTTLPSSSATTSTEPAITASVLFRRQELGLDDVPIYSASAFDWWSTSAISKRYGIGTVNRMRIVKFNQLVSTVQQVQSSLVGKSVGHFGPVTVPLSEGLCPHGQIAIEYRNSSYPVGAEAYRLTTYWI